MARKKSNPTGGGMLPPPKTVPKGTGGPMLARPQTRPLTGGNRNTNVPGGTGGLRNPTPVRTPTGGDRNPPPTRPLTGGDRNTMRPKDRTMAYPLVAPPPIKPVKPVTGGLRNPPPKPGQLPVKAKPTTIDPSKIPVKNPLPTPVKSVQPVVRTRDPMPVKGTKNPLLTPGKPTPTPVVNPVNPKLATPTPVTPKPLGAPLKPSGQILGKGGPVVNPAPVTPTPTNKPVTGGPMPTPGVSTQGPDEDYKKKKVGDSPFLPMKTTGLY